MDFPFRNNISVAFDIPIKKHVKYSTHYKKCFEKVYTVTNYRTFSLKTMKITIVVHNLLV